MPNFEKNFLEKTTTPFRKDTYDSTKKNVPPKYKIGKYEDLNAERREDRDSCGIDLRKMKEGGIDFHFSQIDVDSLSAKSLDLYRKFKKNKLEKDELDKFTSKFLPGDNEYNFAALLRTWLLEKKGQSVEREKETLKEEAKQKLLELKNKKPYIAAHLDDIDLDLLRRLDFKIIKNLNQQNFEDYEKNLREYFINKVESNREEKSKEIKISIIKNDPRFRCYCALREMLDLEPCNPDAFIK